MRTDRRNYFHCAPLGLAAGAIIMPGNWGRIINLYEAEIGSGLPTNVFREALLEQARLIYARTLPSRLRCVFACLNMDDAIAFRNKYQRTNLIYEIKTVSTHPYVHISDHELAIANYPRRYFQSMFDQARDYWVKQPVENHEVLIDCPVEVVRIVDCPS